MRFNIKFDTNMNILEKKRELISALNAIKTSIVYIYDQDWECESYNENLDNSNSFDSQAWELVNILIKEISEIKGAE